MSHLQIIEVVLVKNYQQNSRVLDTFVSIKSFGQLLDLSPKIFLFFEKLFAKSFHVLKYGLLIKILNHWRNKVK